MTDFDPQRLVRDLEERVERAKRRAAELAEVREWGEAADGLIRVCVGPSGALTAVELDPRAMRLPSTDLADGVLAASRAAQQAVAARARQILGPPEDTGGVDVAGAVSGETDVSALVDARLERARQALRRAR